MQMNYTYLKNVSPAKGSIAIIHNNKPYFKAAKKQQKKIRKESNKCSVWNQLQNEAQAEEQNWNS